MKLLGVSLGAIMALVVVIALDCMIIRSVSSRPEPLTHTLLIILLGSLPMGHLMAVIVALLARGAGRARPFLLGFLSCGLLAVFSTIIWQESILASLEWAVEFIPWWEDLSESLELWSKSLPETIMIAVVVSIWAILMLSIQLVPTLAGGWLTHILWKRRSPALVVELPRYRPRIAPAWIVVILLAIPALTVEGYLRWKVDTKITRRPVGSVAVVDLARGKNFPSPPGNPPPLITGMGDQIPSGSPLVALNGARARVERDDDPSKISLVTYSWADQSIDHGNVHVNDHRLVRVTLLDGIRAGEAISLPYCYLRPIR
jgi:hypothetical protein